MRKYFISKIVQFTVMLLLISILSFGIIYIAPGDVSLMYITPDMTPEQIEAVRAELGVDKSFLEQYLSWLIKALQGDFGKSFANKNPVLPQIVKRLPATMKLMGLAMVVSIVCAIPLGLWAGYKKNTWTDSLISGFSYIGMSMPSFWMGTILIMVFAFKLHLFPTSGMHTVGSESFLDTLWHMVLPCITLSLPTTAVYTRFVKANTVRELAEEYVLTAKSKGSTGVQILWRHVTKNTLLPVITLAGMNFSSLVCGSFVIESVFGWPGIGTLAMTAIKTQDYPLIMVYILMAGLLVITGNFVADILYGVADPRIKREIDKANGK